MTGWAYLVDTFSRPLVTATTLVDPIVRPVQHGELVMMWYGEVRRGALRPSKSTTTVQPNFKNGGNIMLSQPIGSPRPACCSLRRHSDGVLRNMYLCFETSMHGISRVPSTPWQRQTSFADSQRTSVSVCCTATPYVHTQAFRMARQDCSQTKHIRIHARSWRSCASACTGWYKPSEERR